METIKEQFKNISKLHMFEIEVIYRKTNEVTYIIFDLSIDKDKLIATHEALNELQKLSSKISFVSIDIDEDFSLEENLSELYDECINAIIYNSTFFKLA